MSTHHVIIFPKPGQVELVTRPTADPAPGQVLVQTRLTLISTGTELTRLSGDFDPESAWAKTEYPFTPGYNNVGVVVKLGEGVEESWLGKRVAGYGPHTEMVRAWPQQLQIIPDEVSDEEAVFFTIGEIVMNGLRRADIKFGETLAIVGLGLLGQMTARIAHIAGAAKVIGIDTAASRRDRLPALPGYAALDGRHENLPAAIRDLNDGNLADVVVELTGQPDLLARELELVRPLGRLLLLSSPKGKSTLDLNNLCNIPSITIIGSHNQSHPADGQPNTPWSRRRHGRLFLDYLTQKRLNLEGLVSHQDHWRQAPALYDMLLKDRSSAMGVLLKWS